MKIYCYVGPPCGLHVPVSGLVLRFGLTVGNDLAPVVEAVVVEVAGVEHEADVENHVEDQERDVQLGGVAIPHPALHHLHVDGALGVVHQHRAPQQRGEDGHGAQIPLPVHPEPLHVRTGLGGQSTDEPVKVQQPFNGIQRRLESVVIEVIVVVTGVNVIVFVFEDFKVQRTAHFISKERKPQMKSEVIQRKRSKKMTKMRQEGAITHRYATIL